MNNATRGARAVGLALALLVAAPSAAHAGWSHRMHWRGLHGSWLMHSASAGAVPTGDRPLGLTFDDATRTVYVANVASNTVSVVDGARCNADRASGCDAPVATLPTGLAPVSAAVARAHAVCRERRGRHGLRVRRRDLQRERHQRLRRRGRDRRRRRLPARHRGRSRRATRCMSATTRPARWRVIDGTTCNRTTTTGCGVVAQAMTGEFSAFPFADPGVAHDLVAGTGPDHDGHGGGQRAHLQRRRDGRLRAPRRHRGRRPRRRRRRGRSRDAHGLRRVTRTTTRCP